MSDSESITSVADIVAAQWRRLIEDGDDVVDPAVVRAAYAQPYLRRLFPGVSHGVMFFAQRPNSTPVGGSVYPQGKNGQFWVRGPLGVGSLGHVDTLEEAFALVVESLPEDCGPAIEGTARDL
ncbi:DUF6193 family natural product biosynthesis protein [Streptomyces sp. NPDC051907]|uniref:DUF6193 family natural product biosynthesis protein n=1 Tax=Streptomyces sp. NPDC051907 TaxID=3155284 RepID=UPI0034367F9A